MGGSTYWRVSGHAAGTERIRTRAGRFEVLRLDGVAVKADESFAPVPDPLLDQRLIRHRLPVRLSVETSLGLESWLSDMALAGR